MSGLLQSYEEDYNETVRVARIDLAALQGTLDIQRPDYKPPPSSGPGSRHAYVRQLQDYMVHLRSIVTSMEYESNDVEAGARQEARSRVAEYKKNIQFLDSELGRLREEVVRADREDFLAFDVAQSALSGDSGYHGTVVRVDEDVQAQRRMMLRNTEELQRGTVVLGRVERYLAQTNDLGSESLMGLRKQRETIARTMETAYEVDGELVESRRLMHDMHRSALKYKAYLMCVIVGLLLLIGLMVWIKRN